MSGFVVVVRHEDEGSAQTDAARLVERGIGATVADAPPPADPVDAAGDAGDADPVDAAGGPGDARPDGGGGGGDAGDGTGGGGDAEPEEEAAVGRWCVQVLAEDQARACEVLGLALPEPEVEEKAPIATWKVILAIWLVAMVVLPLAAFWLTVNLTD